MSRIRLKKVDQISRKTVSDARDGFLRHCQLKNLAPHTYTYYKENLQFFFDSMPQVKFVDEINQELIENFIGQLMDRGNRVTAINARLRAAFVFLRYCFEQEYMEPYPLSLIKEDETFKEPYTDSELQKLLKQPQEGTWVEWRNWAVINLLLATGVRANTVVNIKISDIDFEHNIIRLRKLKNRKQQMIPMSTTLNAALSLYLKVWDWDEDSFLFPCNDNVRHILEAIDNVGVELILYGDPKQDVKGLGQFREILNATSDVNYIPDCHRCPQKHLDISNTLAPKSEQQIADKENAEGTIEIIFESEIKNMQDFLDSGDFGLKYISMKRDRFMTHEVQKKNERQKTLFHEVHRAMVEKWAGHKSDVEINRISFYVTEQMLKEYNGSNSARIISKWVNCGAFDKLSKNRYAQMVSIFQNEDDKMIDIPVVSSIEIVKGREAKRCLFVLSPDLAPYLFREKKEDNKTSHLLYVALTRSLDHITILVMKEVENKYTRDKILKHFRTISIRE